jgi:hypothetical protein
MARVKREPSNQGGYSAPVPDVAGWTVQRVDVESTGLIEFGPTWPGWLGQDGGMGLLAKLPLKGAIAKVTAPGGTSEEVTYKLETALYERGVIMVRIMPSAGDDLVQVHPAVEALEQVNKRSLRQVAVDRALRVQTPRDRDALVALVNLAMDHGEKPPCT